MDNTVKDKLFYTIISYQESLFKKDTSYPIAVLVVSFKEKRVVAVGKEINTNTASEIARKQTEAFPKILYNSICKAMKESYKKPNEEKVFFDVLAQENDWNIYISPMKVYEGSKEIKHVAFEYFLKYVETNDVEKEEKTQNESGEPEIENFFNLNQEFNLVCECC